MAKLLGESIQLGIGSEATRGTPVAPAHWVPARTPTGIRPVLEKVLIRETRATKMASQASEIVQKRAEGDVEFNVRNESIGHILKSLLGNVATTNPETDVYQHVFSLLLNNPQHPTCTLALHQPGYQDYRFPFAIVNSLELRTPVNELVNATASFIASEEQEQSDYTPATAEDDHYFRNHEVTIKLADDADGLGAASTLKVKEFSLGMNNGARADYNVGDLSPSDMLVMLLEITGSMQIDYEGKTYHDVFTSGAYRAMRIEMVRNIDIGDGLNPRITIDLPKISFENLDPNRPMDDIVRDGISFNAHYDDEEAEGVSVTVVNNHASY